MIGLNNDKLPTCNIAAAEVCNIIQIVTGAEVISDICFPEVGKCYIRSKTEGNISQLRNNKFH